MKKVAFLVSTVALVVGLITTSCNQVSGDGTSQQNVDAAKQNLDEAEDAYLVEVEAYRQEVEAKIAENERNLAEFKANIAADKKKPDPALTAKIAELEGKNADLKTRLAEFKADSRSNWDSFKIEFDHDMSVMGDAFSDLFTNNEK